MKAYWIAHVDVTDPEQYLQYTQRAPAAFQAFGGRRAGDRATTGKTEAQGACVTCTLSMTMRGFTPSSTM